MLFRSSPQRLQVIFSGTFIEEYHPFPRTASRTLSAGRRRFRCFIVFPHCGMNRERGRPGSATAPFQDALPTHPMKYPRPWPRVPGRTVGVFPGGRKPPGEKPGKKSTRDPRRPPPGMAECPGRWDGRLGPIRRGQGVPGVAPAAGGRIARPHFVGRAWQRRPQSSIVSLGGKDHRLRIRASA